MGKTATKTSRPALTPEQKAALKAKREAEKAAESAAGAGSEGGKGTKKVDANYYVVYVDTYIDDSQILQRGIYRTNESFERLDNSKPQYVRKFVGSIPDKVVHELAETLRVSITTSNGNYRKADEILEELVQSL